MQAPTPNWPFDLMARKKDHIQEALQPLEESNFIRNRAKFEVYGEEMIDKEVKESGNSGRVYLPPEWVGRHVKIIRID